MTGKQFSCFYFRPPLLGIYGLASSSAVKIEAVQMIGSQLASIECNRKLHLATQKSNLKREKLKHLEKLFSTVGKV